MGLLCRLLPDPCGLSVCRHNTVIIYVDYNYCANNLMS